MVMTNIGGCQWVVADSDYGVSRLFCVILWQAYKNALFLFWELVWSPVYGSCLLSFQAMLIYGRFYKKRNVKRIPQVRQRPSAKD